MDNKDESQQNNNPSININNNNISNNTQNKNSMNRIELIKKELKNIFSELTFIKQNNLIEKKKHICI
jgi:hypothetical protein